MLLHTRIFDIIGIVVLIFSTAFSLYIIWRRDRTQRIKKNKDCQPRVLSPFDPSKVLCYSYGY